jgi:hypothetical protein
MLPTQKGLMILSRELELPMKYNKRKNTNLNSKKKLINFLIILNYFKNFNSIPHGENYEKVKSYTVQKFNL